MSGRILAWPLIALLALALLGQTVRWQSRTAAGKLLHQVEMRTIAAASQGRAPRGLLQANLEALRRAADLDPLEVGIPIARGSQYLLFGDPGSAIDSYQAAAALEPRPEIYLNRGRAEWLARRTDEARRDFRLAIRLDPRLASVIPPEAR
jgi:tetratricopeptide (TPR) repeat protein